MCWLESIVTAVVSLISCTWHSNLVNDLVNNLVNVALATARPAAVLLKLADKLWTAVRPGACVHQILGAISNLCRAARWTTEAGEPYLSKAS
jgi:hypothetical protein